MTALSATKIAQLLGRPAPTQEQVAVIEAPLRPSLVVAGAGSGKTETMAARVVWLIANGLVPPDQVLGLTFTRKAAGELAERVRLRLRRLAHVAAEQGVALAGPAAADDLAGGLTRPTIATYNSYASSLVRDHALRLGLDPSARLLGEAAQWQLAADVVEAWTGDVDTDAATSTVVDAVLALSGALDEHLLSPDEARATMAGIVEAMEATPGPVRAGIRDLVELMGARIGVLDLVASYRERKRTADAIDFGDQVALAARLARDVPEVGAAERDRFRVVLLDEYQDTSFAQLELLHALFGGGHPVTAVGDPHQSIYGWRGASAGGLERFPETFRTVDADGVDRPSDVYVLATSWRNDRAILDAANRVAQPLRAAAARRVDVPVLDPRPGAGDGRVHAHLAPTLDDEARAVAQFVRDRWRPAGEGPDVGRVTAAVLCRKRAQFGPLRRALRDADLPVEVVGLGGLLESPEVVDLVAALQAAHDPTRGDALVRLLTGARTRLGIADLHALAAWAADQAVRTGRRASAAGSASSTAEPSAGPSAATSDVPVEAVVENDVVDERSIVDALDSVGELPARGWKSRSGRTLSPAARARLVDLAGILRTLRGHAYLPIPELVAEAERLLGLDIEVASRPGTTPARARALLDAFRDVAVDFAQSSDHPTLGGFLAWLEAAESRENGLDMPVAEPNPDAVQLITIHAAKGLEWDVVAVAGLVDGGLPATATQGKLGPKDSAWTKGLGVLPYPLRGDAADLPRFEYAGAADGTELEKRREAFLLAAGRHEVAEERRLAYVAVTRARTDLLLTAAWWGTGSRARPVSLFLEELVSDGLAVVDAWAQEPGPGDQRPESSADAPVWWPTDPFGTTPDSRRAAVETSARWVTDEIGALRAREAAVQQVEDRAEPGTDAAEPGTDGAEREGSGAEPDRNGAEPGRNSAEPVTDRAEPGRSSAEPVTDRAEPGRVGAERGDHAGTRLERTGRRGELRGWADLAGRLLDERGRAVSTRIDVELPAHLSASALVRLAADPEDFALGLRRPVPARPSPQARRGTRFHAWVEGWFGRAALVDVDELPGADDDLDVAAVDDEALRSAFLATPWAARTPVAVEVDVETSVDGYVLRSRIDAVFPDDERQDRAPGDVVVVDWKTGRPPSDPESREAREIQLAVYRLAWSRWSGLPLDRVRAAFCYVASGTTVYPERLWGEHEVVGLLRGAVAADDAAQS